MTSIKSKRLDRVRDGKVASGRANLLAVTGAIIIGGATVAGALFAGHQYGQANIATAGVVPAQFSDVISPSASRLATKSSLLPVLQREAALGEITGSVSRAQGVVATGKSDLIDDGQLLKHPTRLARLDTTRIQPAVARLEETWWMSPKRRNNLIRKRKTRLVQNDCLARAIYFEARSESEIGQLAVAKVIMNRVENPAYPNTICGVVYQGAHRRNSCQFSFACDGQTDNPKVGRPWSQAKRVAARALGGASEVQVISAATHYHADYVSPRWARSMRRLKKIGRHIFYHGS